MPNIQLRYSDSDPFLYLETDTTSTAIGVEVSGGTDVVKIVTGTTFDLEPSSAPGAIEIETTTPGDITFRPKGIGQSTFNNGDVEILADSGSGGNLLMQDTNVGGLAGVIEYGGNRFVHNYGNFNTFIGEDAGNFSLVTANARNNTGIGYHSLIAIDGTVGGEYNTALGANSAQAIDVGYQNTAIGYSALGLTTVGTDNTAVGFSALSNLQGVSSISNIAIGSSAGVSLTTNSSDNIMIGNTGTVADTRTTRIGRQTGGDSQTKCFISGISGASITATGAVGINALGQLGASNGANGQVQIGGGSGPVWANITSTGGTVTVTNGANTINLEAASPFVTPVVVADGGTGLTSITDHGVMVGSGTSPVTPLAVGTNGQVLLGSTGADPVFATLTSTGSTISFTPGAGTLNLESSMTPGTTWQEVAVDTPMVANGGYIANDALRLNMTLPAVAAIGATFEIINKGVGGFRMAQQAGQFINFGFLTSTVGATGYIQSSEIHNCVRVVCIAANTEFIVVSSAGNITVV